jgi:hypothetical protein
MFVKQKCKVLQKFPVKTMASLQAKKVLQLSYCLKGLLLVSLVSKMGCFQAVVAAKYRSLVESTHHLDLPEKLRDFQVILSPSSV